jgi:peptidoglycan/xylan/chitin deacetylase (PgdA/CDA1 family)
MSESTTAIAGSPRDVVGYEGKPPKVSWPGGARIAISLVVNYEEGSERSIGDGDADREPGGPTEFPLTFRDLGVETNFEYGSRAGYWRLLDIFDEQDVKCTFYACAVALERNRDAAKEMIPRGHEVMSHGWRWEDVSLLSRDEERDHIRRAIDSLAETTGERPLGWYCRYGPSVHTRELLIEEGGFVYDSDAYNDDLPYFTMVNDTKHLVVPYSLAHNDAKFQFGSFGSPVDFETHLKAAFDWLYKEGETHPKMMSIGLHMRIAGHPGRAQALANFIAYAKSFPGVWFTRRIDIANHWIAHHQDTLLPRQIYPRLVPDAR